MRFLTQPEAKEWCAGAGLQLDERGRPTRPTAERHHTRCDVPGSYTQLTWFCEYLERSLQPREACLLWVTDWGIWHENLHLYYRLRQSYGDVRLLHEAPGHLFLNYEAPDLVSFLQVGILCGWDMHLVPTMGYARAFVSHDEYVEFASDDSNSSIVTEFAASLPQGGTPRSRAQSA